MNIASFITLIQQHSQRMLAIAHIEIIRLFRDRTSLSLILMVPVFQILLFGYAVNTEPRNITLAIARSTPTTPDVLDQSITETGYFTVVADGLAKDAAERMVINGNALVAIELVDDSNPRLIADLSDPSAVRPAMLALQAALLRNSGFTLWNMNITVEWLYNPEGKTTWAIIPGLIGVVVMISMLMLGALTLVRDREQGSWESLLATPVTALDVLIGKLIPYFLLSGVQALGIVLVGHLLLGVPLRGAVTDLIGIALLLAAAHLVLGFALSALVTSQMQAVQAAVFFYLPSMLLSGFMFPFTSMPRWAQVLGESLPLTHFVRASRGLMLRGSGSQYVWIEMRSVVIFTMLVSVIALLCYRRRLN